ncbi:MAG: ASKHA domain-containing protein [Chloroflexi bacterium]|nr:ASKHA domain-containing protein [Chloroflexota bacterium]
MRIRFEPFGITTQAEAGMNLLQAAQAAGVEIESVCGGKGTCGKCKVLASRGLAEPTRLELRSLSEAELAQGYRLACQAIISGDVEVVVPEESRRSRVSILAEGIQGELVNDPWIRTIVMKVDPPSLDYQLGDTERVTAQFAAMNYGQFNPTLNALQQLPNAIREQDGVINLVMIDDQVVEIHAGSIPPRILGMAFDIGTTTVVGYLIDMATRKQVAIASLLNPQTRYGDDVVSRIEFSGKESGLATLQAEIINAINTIINETTSTAGVSKQDIYGLTLVGNTTMQHLLLGVSPAAMAHSPYVPAFVEMRCLKAAELGIRVHPEAHTWILPNIAGWVGADTTAVILATNLQHHDGIALAIDIGTNGEMALGSRERLLACSTAAGPAFEGAHLSCGMRAADGAVDMVQVNGDLHWHTIGNAPPRGICGSGLVDLVAEMLRNGVLSENGTMVSADELNNAPSKALLAQRLSGDGRQRAFMIADPSQGAGGRALAITQRDIRELQLAKGAIRAGIEILMRELGVTATDVKRVYLAGAFGNYIKPASALAIGLIPHFPNAEIVPVGNAAGSGARMALLSASARQEAADLVRRVEYLELSGRPDFQEQFAEAMLF